MTRRFIDPILTLAAIPLVCLQTSAQLRTQGATRESADSRALIQQMVNSVSAESIVNNVRSLQAFGSRYEYNSAQDSAASWIVRELEWWGIPVVSQPYSLSRGIFNDFAIVDQNTICLAATSLILRSSDGGWTWSARPISGAYNPSSYLYAVDFPSPQNGWAVGTYGAILKSSDSGLSWTTQNASASYHFYDVKFLDRNRGLIVGTNGTVLRTSDGGVTWMPVPSGTKNSLSQIKALDSVNLWIVGSNGTILHSTDGGQTWTNQTCGTSSSVLGIEFVDSRLGWAVGAGPWLSRTSNGGASWSVVKPVLDSKDFASSYLSVCFADSSRGWVTDNTGGVLRTTDGGGHWQRTVPLERYGWSSLRRITLLPNNVLVSCGNGKIVRSSDGGSMWVSLTSSLPSGWFHPSRNVVITIPGTVTPDKECVLVAHYDCAYAGTGADDNASGTSALMEAAKILKDYKFESTISLVAVSAEELGMKGSEEYVARARAEGRNIVGVVNADMIGFPLKQDTTRLVVISYVTTNRLADSVIAYNRRYGIGATLESRLDSTGASDHGPFAMAGYDAVQLIEGTPQEIWGGFNPYYHTAHDSLDKLHPGMMRRAAQLMVAAAAELAKPVARLADASASGSGATFVLEQNFPNPFNSQTIMRFKIPQAAYVTLKVFDLLGREVATIFRGNLEAGPYGFNWTAGSASTGLYIYQVQAGPFVSSKKMILLK